MTTEAVKTYFSRWLNII